MRDWHSRGIRGVISGLVLGLLVTATAWAISPGPASEGERGEYQHGVITGRLIERLDLAEGQIMSIQEIFTASREAWQPVVEELKLAKEALRQQIHAPELDEEAIRMASAEVGAIEAELAVGRAATLQLVRAVLTTEQQAELDTLFAEAPIGRNRGKPGRGSQRRR